MKRLFNVFALIAIVAMLFTACSPSPREATLDDMELMARFSTLIGAAREAGVVEVTETGLHFEGEYEAPNGDILTYAYVESTSDPEAQTATAIFESKAIIDGVNHTYSYNFSSSVDASGNPVINYELKIDGTPIKIDQPDIPLA